MNTDRPTPTSRTSAPADSAADESSEPTVALSDAGGEPTVTLAAGETAEQTADLSADTDESSETDNAEPTVMLTANPSASEETTGADPSASEETTGADPSASEEATGQEDGAEATVDLSAAAEKAEETVALPEVAPAAGKDEPATVVSVGDETTTVITAESEPTTTLATGDETTTVITAGRPAAVADTEDEPTIALPKPRVSPESTVALPVSRVSPAGPEPTIAWPRPAGQVPGVTRPAVPAPRTAPTVTPPPSEPTIALPAAPVRPVVVPPQARPLSRRRLLRAIPAVAGTVLAGGTIAALTGGDEPEAAKAPQAPNLQVSERTPTAAPSPAPTTPTPTAPLVKEPVHTLADFRKLIPGEAFPADAIALTIDDGPHPVWTPKILRLLEKHHVPATFFMIGNQILGHEATARDVITDGHMIANHTWSHPIKLAELSPGRSLKEIHRAQDKIYSTTGKTPNLFRAPGGGWSKGLSQSVSQSNMIPIDWTNDPRDWAQPGVAQITSRMLAARPGQILLVHDGGGDRSQTLASLRTVIPALQAKGLKFVALT